MSERIIRVREMYNYWLSNPAMRDRQLRDTIMSRYEVAQSTAYSDITVLRQLIPMLSLKSRDFHKATFVEMALETYAMAKARKDTRSMAAALATYGKMTGVDKDDDQANIFVEVQVQPFCPTLDPTVIGIKPIPQIEKEIERVRKDLLRDHSDMEDVDYEEVDLEENFLFGDTMNVVNDGTAD